MKRFAFVCATLWMAASSAQAQNPIELMRIKSACEKDAGALCADVKPGGGRLLACLQGQQDKLSASCRAALPEAEKLKNEAQQSGQLPK